MTIQLPRTLLSIVLLALSAVPAVGDTLRRGLGPEPDSLDIHQAQGLAALQVLRDTHEGLVTYDVDGELAPGVAASWTVSASGLEYRFRLRPDARWSNGDPVTSEDFVRGWTTALSPATQARTASLLSGLRGAGPVMAGRASADTLGVRADGPGELVVELETPAPWFLEVLAHPVAYPRHASGGPVPQRPVNGAFLMTEVVPHGHVLLARNPAFHAAAGVALEQVLYLPIEDAASELARYRADELHITETIPPGRYTWLLDEMPEDLRVSPYLGSFWLGINLKREPLGAMADLRRALSLAIDRAVLVRVVTGAGEKPAWGVVPPGLPGYRAFEDPAAAMTQPEREDRARELYRQSGFGPDRALRVELRFNTSSQHRRLAVAVAAMWKQVLGVNTDLVHEEWKVFVNNRRQGTVTEVFRGGWIADFADPVSFLDLFRQGSELNSSFYANPDYDARLESASRQAEAVRLLDLAQAEAVLMRDTPVIPLYHYVSRHLVKPGVRGYRDNVRDIHLSRYLSLADE